MDLFFFEKIFKKKNAPLDVDFCFIGLESFDEAIIGLSDIRFFFKKVKLVFTRLYESSAKSYF
ncbi:MAG: hypothetical protein EB053_05290 [Chlamydiae bacterium]|nr:hypothetical protein [Chlamydiota bacterium]